MAKEHSTVHKADAEMESAKNTTAGNGERMFHAAYNKHRNRNFDAHNAVEWRMNIPSGTVQIPKPKLDDEGAFTSRKMRTINTK